MKKTYQHPICQVVRINLRGGVLDQGFVVGGNSLYTDPDSGPAKGNDIFEEDDDPWYGGQGNDLWGDDEEDL